MTIVNETSFIDDGEALVLQNHAGKRRSLSSYDREVYLMCDTIASPGKLAAQLGKRHAHQRFDAGAIMQLLDSLIEDGWVAAADGKYLALAVPSASGQSDWPGGFLVTPAACAAQNDTQAERSIAVSSQTLFS